MLNLSFIFNKNILNQLNFSNIISAAVVQIPKTPPKYKKEAILERRRLFERNEGEVNYQKI